jgi:hypothetical protein
LTGPCEPTLLIYHFPSSNLVAKGVRSLTDVIGSGAGAGAGI